MREEGRGGGEGGGLFKQKGSRGNYGENRNAHIRIRVSTQRVVTNYLNPNIYTFTTTRLHLVLHLLSGGLRMTHAVSAC